MICFAFALFLAIIAISCCFSKQAWAVKFTSEEMAAANRWITENFVPGVDVPPFSFKYGDQHSSDLLKTWKIERNHKKLDDNRTEQNITFTDPDTGLEVRAEAIVYSDFPAIEWVLYFKDTGASDTPILENILPLDTRMSVSNPPPTPPKRGVKGNRLVRRTRITRFNAGDCTQRSDAKTQSR